MISAIKPSLHIGRNPRLRRLAQSTDNAGRLNETFTLKIAQGGAHVRVVHRQPIRNHLTRRARAALAKFSQHARADCNAGFAYHRTPRPPQRHATKTTKTRRNSHEMISDNGTVFVLKYRERVDGDQEHHE
jgi:hypothetical protein